MSEDIDGGVEPTAPAWAVFGDLMSVLLGAFVLILVSVVAVQLQLSTQLEEEVKQRQEETQRRETLEQALAGLPLSQTVKDTLLGRDTQLTPYLRIVLNLELGNWETVEILLHETGITRKAYMDAYLSALRWQQSLPI